MNAGDPTAARPLEVGIGAAGHGASLDHQVGETATRLARLLSVGGGGLSDASRSDLEFEKELSLNPLLRGEAPRDCWAVDGGQALVADARSVQLYATRAATVRWARGTSLLEDEGDLKVHLLGCGEERHALALSGAPVDPRTAVDVNLLRDWGEWDAVSKLVEQIEPSSNPDRLMSLVLIDGDLQPDWRITASWVNDLFERAATRGVVLVGVTKHSSLARGGAPLVGQLEQQAESTLGARSMWWTRVAHTRSELNSGIQVVVARLDPDARFAFRIDLPAEADPAEILGSLSALCDDAAFPGYPYPLSIADRLAACAGWVRDDLWDAFRTQFYRLGLSEEVLERAFADRHRLMERT